MLDIILEFLKQSSAYAWTVSDIQTEGFEYYMIHHKLDQNRVRQTRHLRVCVYMLIEDGKYLGNASCEIAPTATTQEAKAQIETLIQQASYVKNKPYELNPAVVYTQEKTDLDPAKIAGQFLKTMENIEETPQEDINSYEVFADIVSRRFITSTGIDVTTVYPKSMCEVVVNARKDDHEIELYRMYHSGSCDAKTLEHDVKETMHYGKDKLVAQKTPNFGKMDVVFSTDASLQIYNWFIDRLDAQYKYYQISDLELEKPIAKDAKGDVVSLKTVVELNNSSMNSLYDAEGAKRKDLTLIDENVVKNFHGNRQFSQYLGIENSFIPGNFVVSGGTHTMDELRQGEYLEVVEFSDFQVSPFNGDIFGEIRLGYYHSEQGLKIVEGGSVSGTMNDFVEHMYMSKETRQYDNMIVPSVTKLKNVTVTGAE